tara:strand:- start:1448 stop:1648 length:201 start_codon:yes stop_codon:yes gene_type:complete
MSEVKEVVRDDDEDMEMQQCILTLDNNEKLVYYGPAQVVLGQTLKIIDIEFTSPRSYGSGWVDENE